MVAKWYIHVHSIAWDNLLSVYAAYSGLLLAKKRDNQKRRKTRDKREAQQGFKKITEIGSTIAKVGLLYTQS